MKELTVGRQMHLRASTRRLSFIPSTHGSLLNAQKNERHAYAGMPFILTFAPLQDAHLVIVIFFFFLNVV